MSNSLKELAAPLCQENGYGQYLKRILVEAVN